MLYYYILEISLALFEGVVDRLLRINCLPGR